MTTTKSDDEFVTINIKLGVLKRFRMLKAAFVQESQGETVGISEAMQIAADNLLAEKGLKYSEVKHFKEDK